VSLAPQEFFRYCSIICPNETELSILSGLPVDTMDQIQTAAQALRSRGMGLWVGFGSSWSTILVVSHYLARVDLDTKAFHSSEACHSSIMALRADAGCEVVLVTLGDKGALLVTADGSTVITCPKVSQHVPSEVLEAACDDESVVMTLVGFMVVR
jgi:sugar/nucleoside kinase (ribokinase family)